jgi:hypothetical protein
VALVRVYCGLSSRQPSGSPAGTEQTESLTVAVVDDSGRLLHVSEVPDSAPGYARLGAVLAERSGGGADVALATDSEERHVALLLAAAGRPLAFVDEESLDDYAERFCDDDSPEEREAAPSVRRAIGIARALQAGALAAAVRSAPRELTALRSVLAAHAAIASGRQAAAVALRDVLRELYPAALRAYPDPADQVPLAILNALPEPGLLGTGSRSRDEAVVAELVASGVGDTRRISDAVTALRVAISETPRRTGIGKTLTTAVAQTIQQSVAAVRACDSAAATLVTLLAEKGAPAPSAGRRRAQPARPAREPLADLPAQPAQPAQPPAEPARGTSRRPRVTVPPSTRTSGAAAAAAVGTAPPAPSAPPPLVTATTNPLPAPTSAPPGPAHRQPDHLAARPAPAPAQPPYQHQAPAYASAAVPVPAPRPAPEVAPPGTRGDWPLNTNGYDTGRTGEQPPVPREGAYTLTNLPPTVLEHPATTPPRNGRVAPPWQDESLASEPPKLNIPEPNPLLDYAPRAEPEPLPERAARREEAPRFDAPYSPPPLRLVEPNGGRDALDTGESLVGAGSEDNDGDLLIFAAARSAWFVGHVEQQDTSLDWENPADLGWRAAERASEPVLGEETTAGLPRRVPQANLVPGSPLPPVNDQDRGLRIVRDPAAMAAHTTGYFRGSRRGEEVRGFAVGGRPGRESAGGWDFTRDSWDGDRDEGYEYRSAARQ